MDITKMYIGFYKLRKCLRAQVTGINILSTLIIVILLGIIIFQQFYYPRQIEHQNAVFKKQIDYLQVTYANVTTAFEDLKAEIEDFNAKEWRTNVKEIRTLIETLDEKVSYYESAILDYFAPGRMLKRKLLF